MRIDYPAYVNKCIADILISIFEDYSLTLNTGKLFSDMHPQNIWYRKDQDYWNRVWVSLASQLSWYNTEELIEKGYRVPRRFKKENLK